MYNSSFISMRGIHTKTKSFIRRPRRDLSITVPVSLLVLALGLSIVILPSSSLILLQSFPNSSLWRERYMGSANESKNRQLDYYDVLGIRRNAKQDDIKKAFRRLVKKYHPGAYSKDFNTSDLILNWPLL